MILCWHFESCVVQVVFSINFYHESFQVYKKVEHYYNECPGTDHPTSAIIRILMILLLLVLYAGMLFFPRSILKQTPDLSFVNAHAFSVAGSFLWFENYPFYDYKTIRYRFAQSSPRFCWINLTGNFDLFFFFF